MNRRARRRPARRTRTLRRPRPTARQDHRDAPLSPRGRLIWWGIVGALVLGGVVLIVLSR